MNTQSNTAQIIATPGLDSDSTGIIVYWSMLGGECNHASLLQSLTEAGFEDPKDHPPLPTPGAAFWRAVKKFETKHRFARHKKGNTYYLVDERPDDDGELDFTRNVKLNLNAGMMVEGEGDDPENLTEAVGLEYLTQLQRLTGSEVSAWLVKQVTKRDAVGLRPTGGFYFVPRTEAESWRKIASAVHAATSFKVYEIPAMATDEAVEAVLDAVLREAAAEAEAISADLESGDLGPRATRTRAARAERMAQKVEKYEELLGQRIEDYREQLETLSAAAVQAAIAAELEAEAAKEAKGK